VRLERHVGGLSKARKLKYLAASGWVEEDEAFPLARAVHHQLTADLAKGLGKFGWTIGGYSQRGYAKMMDPQDASSCSLPAALRKQARRDRCPVGELTYGLFLAALLIAPE
jgi:hypothetical protein